MFDADKDFEIDDINTPDGTNEGSGLNVFVGENGSGKSTLLEAFSLPILEYKTDNISIADFNNPDVKIQVHIYSEHEFEVDGTMPKGSFTAKGFSFEAAIRARGLTSYLSSTVVSDQKFIKSGVKPADGSPDLRVNVNNPFKGKRFSENDVLFLDRNRLFQTRSGSYNTTRFDRLMEDLNYQYIKNSNIDDLNGALDEKIKKDKVEHDFLANAIKRFSDFSGSQIRLEFIDNYRPFKNAFFSLKKANNQQIVLSNIGSGYEMIFSFMYSFYLSQQSKKQLIILIDEPELHLHPSLQKKFVDFLLEFSKDSQIILTSHSPLLVKQLCTNDRAKIRILTGQHGVSEIGARVLTYISANETNFLAFNLATEEYHNEIYEELLSTHGAGKGLRAFDTDYFVSQKGEAQDSPWMGSKNTVSKHTFIRNQIHHQKENGKAQETDLRSSILKMRSFF